MTNLNAVHLILGLVTMAVFIYCAVALVRPPGEWEPHMEDSGDWVVRWSRPSVTGTYRIVRRYPLSERLYEMNMATEQARLLNLGEIEP